MLLLPQLLFVQPKLYCFPANVVVVPPGVRLRTMLSPSVGHVQVADGVDGEAPGAFSCELVLGAPRIVVIVPFVATLRTRFVTATLLEAALAGRATATDAAAAMSTQPASREARIIVVLLKG
jgi:hypothetical protein